MKTVLEWVFARGEISGVRNLDLLVSLFPALVLHQLLVVGETSEVGYAQLVIDDVTLPLATALAIATGPRKVRPRPNSGCSSKGLRAPRDLERNTP
ncbi:MAG TPA: hypothetical protein VNE42_00090 [Acidimicrobiales bacterium]|nr:hypothetical protein [Acidimicrobiales bacterium]